MPDSQFKIFSEAITIAVARLGSQNKVARAINCSPQNLSQLLQNRRPCPPAKVLMVESISGISRHKLRPDIYPE